MNEDGLDRKRLNARARSGGNNIAEYGVGEEGPMSQGIADWRGKQGKMGIGARLKFC
jgi:hypothetical protein